MINEKPVQGVKTDARPHPSGRKGAMLSLDEVASRAWKARMSPRLRAWATQELAKSGVSDASRRKKAQCILDAYRKKVPYTADPVMGEFMATPDQTLCLDDGNLCIVGGDCDDASITLAAAMMSIGIPAMIVGSSHKEPINTPTHVFMAFQDENDDWVMMDGTTQYPVGKITPHAKEFWVEPGKESREKGEGDFVGMAGHGKGRGDLAAPPHVSTRMLDLAYPGIR